MPFGKKVVSPVYNFFRLCLFFQNEPIKVSLVAQISIYCDNFRQMTHLADYEEAKIRAPDSEIFGGLVWKPIRRKSLYKANGGDDGIRTRGLRLAKPALSQLSYIPALLRLKRMGRIEVRPIRYSAYSQQFSLERRWSSRRFPYGYLVTTSPQSPTLPSAPASLAG